MVPKSRLLDLPAEIRLLIYDEISSIPTGTRADQKRMHFNKATEVLVDGKSIVGLVPLSSTCKNIYDELNKVM